LITWSDFMLLGKDEKQSAELSMRMRRIQPGNCATLIYTSGTTGMPKGVMLSHDNFIFSCKSTLHRDKRLRKSMRVVSYLPLSHAAGQFIDIYMALLTGCHIFFADPTALTGSLVQTLQEVRPEGFFSVPRVWEKIYEKMMEVSKGNTGILAKIGKHSFTQGLGRGALVKRERCRKSENNPQAFSSNWPSF
jgi:long-chain-fatty-acid--CoA ligase ACSBG